ncbi:GDP-mannose 4,6-dehydratase [Micromonospora polyrhachis]|uniref:UDP-glucose 4-epimerase n=1 Tax=Micromonospora polyrhachis TaxID=1282883 RepID=A0A7W7WSD5_9ACTN|nr:NAD-dependent epimerase/dehydratase family protein [Micromonospora polyrhachis]MBB4962015.1 UDP-glucose 4-epimerase [Micromonospora polyrhachis]
MRGGTILVTGGAGFIGSHLVDALVARGDRVVVLDNLPAGRLSNLSRVAGHPNFEFVQGSVLDEVIVDELVHRCDTVVHLAAAVGVKLIMEQPLKTFNTNIRGSQTVIAAAHRYQRKIMIASTSEIYGKNSHGPLAETADRVIGSPAVARWAYSTAKAVDETLANAYHRERGLPTVVVRFFNVVGPRQSPHNGMVIPRLVRQAIRDEPLTIYGDGSQIRCFTHVLDAVAALATLLDTEAAIGETFNVGNPEEVSILDLAERIIKHSASGSQLRLVPYDTAYSAGFEDMERRVPDIGKLCALTGWRPGRTLDDILQDVIVEAQAEARAAMSRV